MPKLSFSIDSNGLPLDFFGAGGFFSFFELGGVLERRESSLNESRSRSMFSSSELGLAGFLEVAAFAGLPVFDAVEAVFFAAGFGFGAAAFFVAGLVFC